MKIIKDKLALDELSQMANIGSEVERALELMDLTLESVQGFPRLRELARLRETRVDYFLGNNQFLSTETSWRKYFSPFTFVARRNHSSTPRP